MTFRLDPNFETSLAADSATQAAVRDGAEVAAENSRSGMRRGPDLRRGHIADQIKVFEEDGEIGTFIDDPFGHLAEYGSANNPPYAPLRRGATEAGYRLSEEG